MKPVKYENIPIDIFATFCIAAIATSLFKLLLEVFPDLRTKWNIYDVTFKDMLFVFIFFLVGLSLYYVIMIAESKNNKEG